MDTAAIEARALSDMGDKTITLEMLRDYIYEAFTAERRKIDIDKFEIWNGLDANEKQKAKWRKIRENHHYRIVQLEAAINKYHSQINK